MLMETWQLNVFIKLFLLSMLVLVFAASFTGQRFLAPFLFASIAVGLAAYLLGLLIVWMRKR